MDGNEDDDEIRTRRKTPLIVRSIKEAKMEADVPQSVSPSLELLSPSETVLERQA